MWQPEIKLLPAVCASMLPIIQDREEQCLAALNVSGSTTYVNALRSVYLHRIVLVVGMFSVVEAVLKDWCGWNDVKSSMSKALAEAGESGLANRFDVYWDAGNVLKHDSGRSYDRLLARQQELDFRIHSEESPLYEEGDLAAGHCLIDVTADFVSAAAELIEQVTDRVQHLAKH